MMLKKALIFAGASILALLAGIDAKAESLNLTEINCLAMNIYFESRNQSILGMVAVAYVTLNRVKSKRFPSTVCSVVWQSRQFSWTQDGKSDNPRDIVAFKHAQAVATATTLNLMVDPTLGALWYHTINSKPIWRIKLVPSVIIGNHIFYNKMK